MARTLARSSPRRALRACAAAIARSTRSSPPSPRRIRRRGGRRRRRACGRRGRSPPPAPRRRRPGRRPCRRARRSAGRSRARVPTSTPLVGSSRSSIFGARISTRAKRSFCWLPPERCATDACGERALTFSSRMARTDGAVLPLAADDAAAREEVEIADGDVAAERQVEEQAGALAVLGEERDAGGARVAWRIDRDRAAFDARCGRDRECGHRCAPRSSVRPEPRRPAIPRISPAAKLEADVVGADDGPGRPSTRDPRPRAAVGVAGGRCVLGIEALQALARHGGDDACRCRIPRASDLGGDPAVAKHGGAVAERQHLRQAMGDEDHRRALRLEAPSRLKSASTSAPESDAVGSSSISTGGLVASARTIMTRCRCAAVSDATQRARR